MLHRNIPVAAVVLLGACGSGGAAALRQPDEYQGCGATTSLWNDFDARELTGMVTIADASAPLLTAPANGATVPFATPPTLQWKDTPTLENGGLTCEGGDLEGKAYDLQLRTGDILRWRVITTTQSWTPGATAWSLLRGRQVIVNLESLRIVAGAAQGGTFQPATGFTFTVGG